MSDSSDRLASLNGSTELGRQSCAYPAPRSGGVGVNDQETESISTQSDGLELFDWDRWDQSAGGGEATDVTTLPDVPSDDKPATRPPLQTPADAAATATDIDGDCPMPDVGSQEPQPSNVWPILSGPQPPRPLNVKDIHLEASPSPFPSSPSPLTEYLSSPPATSHTLNTAEMLLVGQPQATSSPSQKKTRIVKCPEETNQVREIKACYHCKMNKSKCDASTICQACIKLPFPELACIRTPPLAILESVYSRWDWHVPDFLMPSRGQFIENQQIRLFVSFSDGIESPCLEVTARPFLLPNQRDQRGQAVHRWGVFPDEGPSEETLYRWAQQQILSENSTGFEAQMDKLLLFFALRPGHSLGLPFETLANLLKMRSMWKVWSCKQLFFRQQAGAHPVSPFDLRLASIQEHLRLLAAQKISELERCIVGDIETHLLLRKDTARGSQPQRPRLDIAKWLLLWQIILMYRQSLSWMLQQEQTNSAPIHIGVMPMTRRHNFRETTIELLNAMTVIYSGVFHKNTTVTSIRDAEPQVFGDDCQLHMLFQRAWQALPEFYEQVSRQVSPADELFKERIVRKESNILAKGRSARK